MFFELTEFNLSMFLLYRDGSAVPFAPSCYKLLSVHHPAPKHNIASELPQTGRLHVLPSNVEKHFLQHSEPLYCLQI